MNAMLDFLKHNPLVEGARQARFRPTMAMQLLLFFVVMTVAEMVAAIPVSVYTTFRMMSMIDSELLLGTVVDQEALLAQMDAASEIIMREDTYLLLTLLSMGVVILATLFYCGIVERRPIASMGVALDRRTPLQWLLGLLFGFLMLGATFLICYLTGALSVTAAPFSIAMLLLYFLGFLVQGTAEEFLFRGYLMPSLCNATSPMGAVIISALFFAMAHASNAGFSFLAAVNILVFGVFLGLLVLRTHRLWLASGIHAAWNFACGSFFGMPVSGLSPGHKIFVCSLTEGRDLTSGGVFGPEGGIATTLILTVAIILLLYLPGKRSTPCADEKNEM